MLRFSFFLLAIATSSTTLAASNTPTTIPPCTPTEAHPCYQLTTEIAWAARDIDNHKKHNKSAAGSQFAEKYFKVKTLQLGSLDVSTTETGWSATDIATKNVENWLLEKNNELWKGYYTLTYYLWDKDGFLTPLLGEAITSWFSLPEVTAGMVALALYDLQEINQKVGEILTEVKTLERDLQNLGKTLIEWDEIVVKTELRNQTMDTRCQNLMGQFDTLIVSPQKDPSQSGVKKPDPKAKGEPALDPTLLE